MPRNWVPIPLDTKLFENVRETALSRAFAALENAYVNEADGISRFPGLTVFKELDGNAPVHLYRKDYRGDMIAVTHGRLYAVDKAGNATDKTRVPVAGRNRVTFAETPTSLLAAAGEQIVVYDSEETAILSRAAPRATHVGYIDGFAIAGEYGTDRWQHSAAADFSSWDPLDTFAAGGSPDLVTAILVTPFRELLVAGPESIEQYERLPSGDPPFFRRWSVGGGIAEPYTFTFTDNFAWGLSRPEGGGLELSRFSGQTSQPASDDINRRLEYDPTDGTGLDDLREAWAAPLAVSGQRFILLCAPNASTPYGTKGVTLLFDYRSRKWSTIFGWDDAAGQPTAWPGWSIAEVWGRRFVGGRGVIYEMSAGAYDNAGQTSRFLLRTAHLSNLGEVRIDGLRVRFTRGTGSYTSAGTMSVRANRDNLGFGNWSRRSFGLAGRRNMYAEFGAFGCATSWQIEIQVTDSTPVDIQRLEALVTPLGH